MNNYERKILRKLTKHPISKSLKKFCKLNQNRIPLRQLKFSILETYLIKFKKNVSSLIFKVFKHNYPRII